MFRYKEEDGDDRVAVGSTYTRRPLNKSIFTTKDTKNTKAYDTFESLKMLCVLCVLVVRGFFSTLLEIVKGLHKVRREERIKQFLAGLSFVELLPLDLAVAVLAGRIYADLERIGQSIGRAIQ